MTVEPGTDMDEDRLFNLGFGLIYRWVCAPISWDAGRVAAQATANDPPGTSVNRWVVTDISECLPEAIPEGVTQNPMPCNDCVARRHWMINC